MTPQEQEMIGGLIDRVQQTKLQEKDTDAENLLQQGLGRNPDALYILAQTVLVQKYALDQAQKQLGDLKSQVEQSRQAEQPKHTSFLGSLLGHNDPPPPPPPPPAYAQGSSGSAPQYAPVPGYAPPASAPSQLGAPAAQGGGFLRSALQTATGVAAGALAFQGIESLMHGFGGSGGGFGGAQGLGGFGGGAPREEVINNYYGDSGSDRGGLSGDIEDRRGDAFGDNFDDRRQADDTGSDYGTSDDLSSSSDDLSSASDDSSFDSGDSGSFDSGGGDDSSFS